jgi:uncharacterized protein Usg
MSTLDLQLRDYRLTTAEILYHMPDYPALLQAYLWQEYDIAPKYPVLSKFLRFWEKKLEGRLHSVKVTTLGIISDANFRFAEGELLLH